jgi:hypothetical protein
MSSVVEPLIHSRKISSPPPSWLLKLRTHIKVEIGNVRSIREGVQILGGKLRTPEGPRRRMMHD